MLEHILDSEIPILEEEEDGYSKINMSLQTIYEEAKKKGKFISLGEGESFEGEFVGVEQTTGQFGEVNTFTFLIEGEEKILNSKSFKLLKGMIDAEVKEGDKVKITKEGTGFKTTFSVEKLS